MRARGSDSMASLTSMTCDDDLRGACSKGWEPPFIGDKEEMERLSKLRKTASLPYIHQRNPSFSYKSKGIGLMVDHISIWEIWNTSLWMLYLLHVFEVAGIQRSIFDFSGRGRGSHHPNWTSIQEDSGHCGEQAFLPEETDFLPRYPRLGGYYVVLAIHNEFTINVANLLFSM